MNEIVKDKTGSLTHKIADFTCSFALKSAPAKAVANAKGAILDCLGVSVLATTQEIGANLIAFARKNTPAGPATIWGTKLQVSARDAALINGTLAHGLDFDDRAHSTTYSLATPLAQGEQMDLPGIRLLEAFIVAREVRNCLDPLFSNRGDGVGPGAKGWHSNGILGPIAAACGAAKVLGLDRQATLAAIGLATGSCGALTRDGGTMAKPFRCGHAAQTGLTAALLAESGISSDDTVIEGQFGLLSALGAISTAMSEGLGEHLGVKFHLELDIRGKTYASCTASQGGLEAMLRLVGAEPIDPAQVEAIDCDLKPYPLVRHIPKRGYEGRFSMAYVLATALVHRRLDPNDFTDAAIKVPAVQDLMRKTRHVADSPDLVVTLKDGRKITEPVKHPQNISTWDDFSRKFRSNVKGILADAKAEEIVRSVQSLETLASVRSLGSALRP